MHPVTKWHFVRHAPVIKAESELYASNDEPADISDNAAFKVLASRLPADAVWITSHLQRARQTAAGIREAGLDFPRELIERDLAEQDFGDWHGQEYDDVQAAMRRQGDGHKFWMIPAAAEPPNGESFFDVLNRVHAAIERLTREHQGKQIVAVAHGNVIRAALTLALGLEPNRALGLQIQNLSTTRIDHVPGPGLGGDWRVCFMNARAK